MKRLQDYDEIEVYDTIANSREEWVDEFDDYEIIFDNQCAMKDIYTNGGIQFPDFCSLASNLNNEDAFLLASLGNTSVFLDGEVSYLSWEEEVHASITLSAYSMTEDEDEEGDVLFAVEAIWHHEATQPTMDDSRDVLEWLYYIFQDEWDKAYQHALIDMEIGE